MSPEEIDKTIKAVRKMRFLQKQYFRTGSKQVLLDAKEAEQVVDKLIEPQKSLFDNNGKL